MKRLDLTGALDTLMHFKSPLGNRFETVDVVPLIDDVEFATH